MSVSRNVIEQLKAVLAQTAEPAQRALVEQIIAALDATRSHEQQIGGEAQLGIAVAGDSSGSITLDQSMREIQTQGGDYAANDIDKRIINIIFAGDDPGKIIQILSATGITFSTATTAQSTNRKYATQLLVACETLRWAAPALRSAFSKQFPYHTLPLSTDDALFQAILYELADNTLDGPGSIRRFVNALLAEPEVNHDQRAALCAWLGLDTPQALTQQEPGLLIAIDLSQEAGNRYHLRAWRWPDRLQLWPPIGEEKPVLALSELPSAIKFLYTAVQKEIAHFGSSLRVEFLLHHSLLTEPTHEWKIAVIFDEHDPEDLEERALIAEHSVVVRSVERAFSRETLMMAARARWRERWSMLQTSCQLAWQRPQDMEALQHPPFYCVMAREAFVANLYSHLSDDAYLCFVESVAPPNDVDFIKHVIKRVIRAGIPFGFWFARNADRDVQTYQYLERLLEPRLLPEMPHVLREHWRHVHFSRPLLFFDDPTRLPYDPEDSALETPRAG